MKIVHVINHMKTRTLTPPSILNIKGLERYSGVWDFKTAAHLLRRTTYGASKAEIQEAVDVGLQNTIEQLFADIPLPKEPINFSYEEDPEAAIGASWINKSFSEDAENSNKILTERRRSLSTWTLRTLTNSGIHIREKMTLFWNNHFVTQSSVLKDPNLIYFHNTILRRNALGNFRTMTEEITISPSMLRYLNGNQNSKNAPNENYARELMELFTVGKGPQVDSGDYTTFTEDDVLSAAKVLTGWRDEGYYLRNADQPGSYFTNGRHDVSEKVFSERLGNAIVYNRYGEEYKDLIRVLLKQENTALNLARKIYRWFVYYDITEEIESTIISGLAKILIDNDYEIKPVLQVLLQSEHFYEIYSVGPMIKNPIDFLVNLFRQFNVTFPNNEVESYNVNYEIIRGLEGFDFNYYEPPNVAGFKAYYQEPLYYRTWITAVSLPIRQAYTNAMAIGNNRLRNTDILFGIDALGHISELDDPTDPNSLIQELAAIHLPQPLTDNQIATLKEILIPGLPDFEWTVEYGRYLEDPQDDEVRISVERKLRIFLISFLSLAEYNLS